MSSNKRKASGGGGAKKVAKRSKKSSVADEASAAAAAEAAEAAETGVTLSVEDTYAKKLSGTTFYLDEANRLETQNYAENVLWPAFLKSGAKSSRELLLCLTHMILAKHRQQAAPFDFMLASTQEQINEFFGKVADTMLQDKLSVVERTVLTQLLDIAVLSLEVKQIRKPTLKFCSMSIWLNVSEDRLDYELSKMPKIARKFKKVKADDGGAHKVIVQTINWFFEILREEDELSAEKETLAARCLELLIDMLSQLPTRRCLHMLVSDQAVAPRAAVIGAAHLKRCGLLAALLGALEHYEHFAINNFTREPLSADEAEQEHCRRMQHLQALCFSRLPDKMRHFALLNVASLDEVSTLRRELDILDDEELRTLAEAVHVNVALEGGRRDVLLETMVRTYQRRASYVRALTELPVFPTEKLLFDETMAPSGLYDGSTVLALPKLTLQYLTFSDYLLRNYNLYRLESAYDCRLAIKETLRHLLRPAGWARYGARLGSNRGVGGVRIKRVERPHIGEVKPGEVLGEITVNLVGMSDQARREWRMLRPNDPLFVIAFAASSQDDEQDASEGAATLTVDGTADDGASVLDANGGGDTSAPAGTPYRIRLVRGCSVLHLVGSDGEPINYDEADVEAINALQNASQLHIRVTLDNAQYHADARALKERDGDKHAKLAMRKREKMGVVEAEASAARALVQEVYAGFSAVVRRRPKEVAFKGVLDTMRELLATQATVPEWLHDLLLGYGDPRDAVSQRYGRTTMNYFDTFLDADHVRESFPQRDVRLEAATASEKRAATNSPPFTLELTVRPSEDEEAGGDDDDDDEEAAKLASTIVCRPSPTRWSASAHHNTVRFTPRQVEAITAGMRPGCTLVVGPPGTGKTDTAVQIISNLYHQYPQQRVLMVTHSNQALNQLFDKLVRLDIDERHLLRLGHGEEMLDTEKDFSKFGRVNFVLQRRLELLANVQHLAETLAASDATLVGAEIDSCQTAAHFYRHHVLGRWEHFLSRVAKLADAEDAAAVRNLFPFTKFFVDMGVPAFGDEAAAAKLSASECKAAAQRSHDWLKTLFDELDECRAFELLRYGRERTNFLATRQARIVAMTCTHAGLQRQTLVELGFQYDTLLMEEAAQVLECETFIPMLLQRDAHRLQRVVLIGDHNQLPPVVKNSAFQRFANFNQSMFARLVRIGVPHIVLDAQGRSRPQLADLFRHRYPSLRDLAHVRDSPAFLRANAGLRYTHQLVDVGDLDGVGEAEPTAHNYVNVAEAEMMVQTFMYLRLHGVGASQIALLATYAAQESLLREVVQVRCAQHPLFGAPRYISTVDAFQGQQADYVLLSLVRTTNVGFLRDVRRLTVAVSRARLGLYVFCRSKLFSACADLATTFEKLSADRPSALALVSGEERSCTRSADEKVADERVRLAKDATELGAVVHEIAMRHVNGVVH